MAQSVILGELVDYFTLVSREQAVDCTLDALGINTTTATSTASTVDAYMYSLGALGWGKRRGEAGGGGGGGGGES